MNDSLHLFFSVGEPSGDLHGGNLIRHIRDRHSNARIVGYGGPKMQAAGCKLHHDLTQLSVMWFLQVFANIRSFWKLLWQADDYFRDHKPDAVILIDYPGFNWWIARRAKAHQIPVFYYGTPQMWAWAGWRIHKMKRLVDHVLCKLPFEVDWYSDRGCTATYVGHPYFDELSERKTDMRFVESVNNETQRLVTILPGSRTQEVKSNLTWFLKTAKLIRKSVPNAEFAIASFNEKQARMANQMTRENRIDIPVFVGKTPELINAAHCCLACSGSVSLELLYHGKPTVVHYFVSRFGYFVQAFFRRVRYITLANLLATDDRYCRNGEVYDPIMDARKVPFPEYLTCTDKSHQMANHIIQWLTDGESYTVVRQQLDTLKQEFAIAGASERAAEYIVNEILSRPERLSHHRAA